MTILVLAMLWGAYLVPPMMRQRAERQPTNSVHSFKRQLRDLGHSSPTGRSGSPHRPDPDLLRRVARRERRRRRTQIVKGFGLALFTSLVVGLTMNPVMLRVHVVLWVLAALYIAMLVQAQRRKNLRVRYRREMRGRVTPLPARAEYDRSVLRRAQ